MVTLQTSDLGSGSNNPLFSSNVGNSLLAGITPTRQTLYNSLLKMSGRRSEVQGRRASVAGGGGRGGPAREGGRREERAEEPVRLLAV